MRVTLVLLIAFLAFAPRPALSEELDELKTQVQELRQEIKTLQNQLNSHKMGQAPPREEKGTRTEQHLDHDSDIGPGSIDLPKLNIRGFMDVGWNASKSGKQKTDAVTIGQMDLLITSKLSERANVVVETYFNNPPDNSAPFLLPRALIQYMISDQLNLRFGGVHTMVGYWNHAYHHGSFLQTSYSRPEIWRYNRTYLPIHSVGAEFFGAKDFQRVDVQYTLGIYNGRGSTGGSQRVTDANDSKAVGLVVSLTPHGFVEGLTVGGTFYGDKIPPNCLPPCTTATTPAVAGSINRTQPMAERIVGSHVLYRRHEFQLIGEVFHIYHDDDTTQRTYQTLGYYVDGEYAINSLTPYFRFDHINFGNADPLYSPNVIDLSKYMVGIRWDFLPWNALKIEYSYSDNKNTLDNQSVVANVSFTF